MNRIALYVQLGLRELAAWRRGPHRRTKERIVAEYRSRLVDPARPVVVVDPDGRVRSSTVGAVRTDNWKRILEGLLSLGVRSGVVLEVGAGDGINLRGLHELAPEITWIGCDLTPRDTRVIACSAEQLPFASKSVDAVITYAALEQMPGETGQKVLTEIARVSRRGLVAIEPDYQRAQWLQRLAMIRKDYIRDIVRPSTEAGLTLRRRAWAVGKPLTRLGYFVFAPESEHADHHVEAVR